MEILPYFPNYFSQRNIVFGIEIVVLALFFYVFGDRFVFGIALSY